jgi:hypothetical protein
MAVSNQDILNFLNANPGMSDAGIASAMQQYGVSPAQMAQATGTNVADIAARFEAATAPNQTLEPVRNEDERPFHAFEFGNELDEEISSGDSDKS